VPLRPIILAINMQVHTVTQGLSTSDASGRSGRSAKLLVSVRDATEAGIAVKAGADWIDVKEPSRGALGRSDTATIGEVAARVAGRRPVSAAAGELDDLAPEIVGEMAEISGLQLVKIGLAGVAGSPDWITRWYRVIEQFRDVAIQVAAVAYADWRRAAAPPPETIIAHAVGRCDALLVDTFDKLGPATTDLLAPESLADLVAAAHQAGMLTVLAGRLSGQSLRLAATANPAYVGVRGAVCRGNRTSAIDARLVREARATVLDPHTFREIA
jgi:uncharacterized protein (UPF0264 family)